MQHHHLLEITIPIATDGTSNVSIGPMSECSQQEIDVLGRLCLGMHAAIIVRPPLRSPEEPKPATAREMMSIVDD